MIVDAQWFEEGQARTRRLSAQCVHPVAVRAVQLKLRADFARGLGQLSQRAFPSRMQRRLHVYAVNATPKANYPQTC